jgi:hypothetical protein
MPENLPAPRDAARPRIRGIVTTVLMIMLAIMIVRDIFVRRWGSAAPQPPDVTHRSP